MDKYVNDQMKLIGTKKSSPDKLKLVKAALKKLTDIGMLVNEFAQNSTSYPAYNKKITAHT